MSMLICVQGSLRERLHLPDMPTDLYMYRKCDQGKPGYTSNLLFI